MTDEIVNKEVYESNIGAFKDAFGHVLNQEKVLKLRRLVAEQEIKIVDLEEEVAYLKRELEGLLEANS